MGGILFTNYRQRDGINGKGQSEMHIAKKECICYNAKRQKAIMVSTWTKNEFTDCVLAQSVNSSFFSVTG